MPSAALTFVVVGTTMGADARGGALDGVGRFGDCPVELGGEPNVVTFTMVPQLKEPPSVGGVKTGTSCSTFAFAGLGLVLERSFAPSSWQMRGLSTWRGSSGFDSGPAPTENE